MIKHNYIALCFVEGHFVLGGPANKRIDVLLEASLIGLVFHLNLYQCVISVQTNPAGDGVGSQRAKSRGFSGGSPRLVVFGGGNPRGNLGCK